MVKSSTQTAGLSNSPPIGSIADRAAQIISNIQTKFRDPVRYKVRSNHRLETILLTGPTICAICRQNIWLFGERCKQCKLSIHKKCLDNLEYKCIKIIRKDKSFLQESHVFEKNYFMKPTYCCHCGVMLMGITSPQGLECKRPGCGMSVHYDCKDLVCHPCCQDRFVTKQHVSTTRQNESLCFATTTTTTTTTSSSNWSGIGIEDFDLICLLGRGSFSKVFLARLRHNEKEFAIKVIKKSTPDPESALTEMRVLSFGRQYPFLTVVHCCFQSIDRLYYVMEYVVGRSLFYHLIKARKFTENRARFYSAEVVLALAYLHRRGVAYRDLKLDNIILDERGHCKLIDFGMSKEISRGGTTRTFCGTPSYISPETIKMLDYGYSVDWWALGVLMFEMLVGCSPFGENAQDDETLYQEIVNNKVTLPRYLSEEARSILEGLLTKDPVNRLGCNIVEGCEQAIFDHPFFIFPNEDNVHQWDNLAAKLITPPYRPTEDEVNRPEYFDTEALTLTPVKRNELEDVSQEDFIGFSFCSESFSSTLKID